MHAGDIVERGTILRATVGSTLHGLHHGGQDDRDEMAVFIEPPEYLLGLRRAPGIPGGLYGFEHFVARTQPEGARSGPGDRDLVAYSLRKYGRLALKGHPTILLLLFVPDELVLVKTELGNALRDLRPALLSRRAGRGYLGYLRGQKERLLETRGRKGVNRPELLAAHGFDTKYAMHAARLGHQGLEVVETGSLTLPMLEPERCAKNACGRGGTGETHRPQKPAGFGPWGFDSLRPHHASVAQLERAPDFESGGQRFDSSRGLSRHRGRVARRAPAKRAHDGSTPPGVLSKE